MFDATRPAKMILDPADSAKAREPQVGPVMAAKPASSPRRVESAEDPIAKWVAASMNAHMLFERGIRLRRQAEGFVVWCRQMGEPDGKHGQKRSASLRRTGGREITKRRRT